MCNNFSEITESNYTWNVPDGRNRFRSYINILIFFIVKYNLETSAILPSNYWLD